MRKFILWGFVILGIAGVLAAATTPKLMKAMDKSQVGRRMADLASMRSQMMMDGYSLEDGLARIRDPEKKPFNTEDYESIYENPFLLAGNQPVSTFSIDVDAASYSNVRRFLNEGRLPPKPAVRIEEMINYFHYDYPQPADGHPFSIVTELSVCPWNKGHHLLQIGIQGKVMEKRELPPSNLVFLIDVSGSMDAPDKLPLLKAAMKLLVKQLGPADRVSMVVYAGSAGLVLPSTPGSHAREIISAIDSLEAGGSTAGAEGIQLAYSLAADHFIENGNNRVILATDGDFNVGVSSDGELVELIEEKRATGIFLTVLGFGEGNLKDAKMEKLAGRGNGHYAYIDNILEAKKVLVSEIGATLHTIAKDVKIQIEFNPTKVKAYRLIGYENRLLAREDFNDDQKDAGDLGAGHTVTALYEIIPAVSPEQVLVPEVDPLKYQVVTLNPESIGGNEMLTLKLRYKLPDGDTSRRMVTEVMGTVKKEEDVTDNFLFASAVAEFGLMLRTSKYRGTSNYDAILSRAYRSRNEDIEGYRAEFIRLVTSAKLLAG